MAHLLTDFWSPPLTAWYLLWLEQEWRYKTWCAIQGRNEITTCFMQYCHDGINDMKEKDGETLDTEAVTSISLNWVHSRRLDCHRKACHALVIILLALQMVNSIASHQSAIVDTLMSLNHFKFATTPRINEFEPKQPQRTSNLLLPTYFLKANGK